MLVTGKTRVQEYIPQRDPIVMVDSLVDIENDFIRTEVIIGEGNMFALSNKKISYYGVIEHIAQSYALAHGYLYGSDIGMIGKITSLNTFEEPYEDRLITTEITVMQNFQNLVLINANSFQDNKKIIFCEMYLHFNS